MSISRPLALCVLGLTLCACARPLDQPDGGPGADGGIVSCVDDSQCNGGFCSGGLCVATECVTKATCPFAEVCRLGVCGAPPATCSSAEDCPGLLQCDAFSQACVDPAGEGEGEGEEGEGEGEPIDLSGYVIQNRQSGAPQDGTIPDGTELRPGEVLVIGRDASRAQFEGFWDRSLADNAVYLNFATATAGVPIINGDEKWAIVDDDGDVVDGPTIVGVKDRSYQRTSAGAASSANSWLERPAQDATPGEVDLPASGVGLVISEWSDAIGNGAFAFEFIELYYAP